ncbi:hypothetical protein NXS15_03435 [Mycoplasma sp. CSL7475-4]|uniref:MAG3960 family lipoprotein n=1 Tax=Mycoplasma sp. CSL7475-4 TaxID=2973942 RepID=UPI00216B3AFA|nr:hypothetical protein [Mycoplasma sp. CSL7475-4]MCS4537165.1 hypothetical protein [Mycoplasma sp. CSL7475-4]
MMKKKIKWLLSGAGLSVVPVMTSSCIWSHYDEPIPKPDESKKTQTIAIREKNKDDADEKHNEVEVRDVRQFSYNGMTFNVAPEDTYDANKRYYADMVLENDASEFKKFLNSYGDYWITNLNEYDFPTLVDVSRYVRSLVVKKGDGIKYSSADERNISAKEYNALITKLLEILDVSGDFDFKKEENREQKISYVLNKDDAIGILNDWLITDRASLFSKHYDDWLKIMGDNVSFGRKKIEFGSPYWYEISAKDEDAKVKNINGKKKKVPSAVWKLNRDIYLRNMFDNEMFLSRAFYAKTLAENEIINNDWIDWLYLNDSSVLAMQVPQYRLLVAYLRLMKKLTDSINFVAVDDEAENAKKIKENGSIVDKSKNLELNILDSGTYALIEEYEKALLDYLALEHAMGFMGREDHNPNLQLFGGGTNYGYKVDYRDTYKWAKKQYEEFVLPLKVGLGNATWASSSSSSYNKRFNNPQTIEKYKLIWADIKEVDGVERPQLITIELARERLGKIINLFNDKFGWKYKR